MVEIKKTNLSTMFIRRSRDEQTYETTVRKGEKSGGSGSGDQGPIFFYRNPSVLQSSTQVIEVTTQVSVTIDPTTSDQWWGIWPLGPDPTDAEVKAGTGALLTSSVAGVADISVVTDAFDPSTLVVGTAYELHWYAEVTGMPEENARAPAVTFTVNAATPSGKPSIDGTPLRVGEELTCNTTSITDPDGIVSFTYEWLAAGVVIPGATAVTFTLTEAEKGKLIQVRTSHLDGNNVTKGPLTSAAYGPVAALDYPPTGTPLLSGGATTGAMLTLSRGTVDDANGLNWPSAATGEWRHVSGSAITGASGAYQQTYAAVAGDIGESIEARWNYTDDDGFSNTTAWSNAIGPIVGANIQATGAPSITGPLFVGYTLQAGQGSIDDANGVPPIGEFTWEWKSGGVIVGTAATYKLQPSDGGKKMRLVAKFTDLGGYSEECISAETVAVGNPTYSEWFHDFSTSSLGAFSYSRTSTDTVNDYRATPTVIDAEVPGFVGGEYGGGSTWTDRSVGYGLNSDDLESSVTTTLGVIASLPSPGLINNYTIQQTFRLTSDLAYDGSWDYAMELWADVDNINAVQIRLTGAAEMSARLKIGENDNTRMLRFDVTGAVAGSRLSFILRKSDNIAENGWYGQCRIDDGAPIEATADIDCTGDHTAPIESLSIGHDASEAPDRIPAEYQQIRISPIAESDETIAAWGTWEQPVPIHQGTSVTSMNFGAEIPETEEPYALPLYNPGWNLDNIIVGRHYTLIYEIDTNVALNYDWQHPFDPATTIDNNDGMLHFIMKDLEGQKITCTATGEGVDPMTYQLGDPVRLWQMPTRSPTWSNSGLNRIELEVGDGAGDFKTIFFETLTLYSDEGSATKYEVTNGIGHVVGSRWFPPENIAPGSYVIGLKASNDFGVIFGDKPLEVRDISQQPTTGAPGIKIANSHPELRALPLIYANHFSYQGSWQLPNASPTFEWSGGVACMHSNGTQFYHSHHAYDDMVSLLDFPEIGGVATQVAGPLSVPRYDMGNETNYEDNIIGGLHYGGRLITSTVDQYDNEKFIGKPGLTWSAQDLSSTDGTYYGATGFETANPDVNRQFYGHHLGHIPAEWQAAFGAPAFGSGSFVSIRSGCCNGWSFIAFDPEDVGTTGNDIPMEALMYYVNGSEIANTYIKNPMMSQSDQAAAGGFIVSETRSLLFISSNNQGHPYYKRNAVCGSKSGEMALPKQRMVYAYDLLDLLEVKDGLRHPNSVMPYAKWPLPGLPPALMDTACQNTRRGCLMWDDANKLLHVGYLAASSSAEYYQWGVNL